MQFTSFPKPGYRLENHTVRTIEVFDEDLCQLQCYLVLRLFSLVVIRHFFMRITAVPFLPDARFRLSVPRSPFLVLVACEINEIKVQVLKKNVQSTSSEKKKKCENSVGPKSKIKGYWV